MGGGCADPAPGERVRHHTWQRDWHEGACGGRGGALWAVALTGRGAVGLDSPGGTLTGLGEGLAPPGPLSLCCPASCWPFYGPGQMRGKGDLGARPGQCGTTRSGLSVVPEPGRFGGRKGGGYSEGSSTHCQRHPPGRAQCPGKVGMEAVSDTGALLEQGCRGPDHCGRPWVWETTGPSPTPGWRAGQCRAVSLLQEGPQWEHSSSIPVLRPPLGWGVLGHPAVPWAQSTAHRA